MENNKIAVIILNYNSWKETIDVAKNITRDFNIPWNNIIVIDNCSNDQSREMLQEKANLGYIYLKSDKNGGYAYGNNIGLRYAKEHNYKYAWIINNDIIVEDEKYLDKIVKIFENNKDVAVVNSDIKSMDGYLYNRNSTKPSFFDLTFGLISYRKKGRVINDLGGYGYIYKPQGCCMVADLDKLDEINYLDEKTFLYHEESILAERLLSKGYRCCCCIDTSIIHNHSKIVKSNIKKLKLIQIDNSSYDYYLKEYRKFNSFQILICKLFNTLKLLVLD